MVAPGRVPTLVPESQFPEEALQQSVQTYPEPGAATGSIMITMSFASAADNIPQWGLVVPRDRDLRRFWPTETLLAGTLAEMALKQASYSWEITHTSDAVVGAVTDMLNAAMGRNQFGWITFIKTVMQDLYSQDNGCFIELIRDPTLSPRFRAERAPVLGIAHLDAGQCTRTGNPEFPVLYTDRNGKQHKLAWYQVIAMADFPSSIEKMNGVGYCSVSRVLRYAQIMRSIALYKDEKISGRRFKSIHLVSGVSRTELDDAKKRGREEADNEGNVRYVDPVILASLDPEKPVSTVSIDLAALPDGFDYDAEMRWYVTVLSLGFNTDYQTIAPLASGNIGSSSQSEILHRKSSGKSPMRELFESFKNYGVLPRGCDIILQDQNEEEELERQMIRTKAQEEGALAIRNYVLTPQAVRDDFVKRRIYTKETIASVPEDYGLKEMDPGKEAPANAGGVGQRGGNTMAEDSTRQETGKPKPNVGDRLRKMFTRAS